MAEEKKAFFTYKGVPLVRKGNNIYFGNMYDEFVVMIEILSKITGVYHEDTRRFCMCCMLFNIRSCYKGHYFIYHFLWQIVILKFACIIFYAKIAYFTFRVHTA